MKGLLDAVQRWLAAPPRERAGVQVRRQYVLPSRGSPNRSARIVVPRSTVAYWQERGWRQEGSNFVGLYQTPFATCHGTISMSPSGRIEVYIYSPPDFLRNHPHWQCFNARSGGWYAIHPTRPVADVSAGILAVEKTLTEAYAKHTI